MQHVNHTVLPRCHLLRIYISFSNIPHKTVHAQRYSLVVHVPIVHFHLFIYFAHHLAHFHIFFLTLWSQIITFTPRMYTSSYFLNLDFHASHPAVYVTFTTDQAVQVICNPSIQTSCRSLISPKPYWKTLQPPPVPSLHQTMMTIPHWHLADVWRRTPDPSVLTVRAHGVNRTEWRRVAISSLTTAAMMDMMTTMDTTTTTDTTILKRIKAQPTIELDNL